MSRFYLTTAIDYSNGDPHIGHAYEKIGADAIARYHRLRGDDVHFLMGMDEHGQTVAQKAAERGVTPQQQVDDIAARFQAMWSKLAISHDQFIRTTADSHKAGVRALIERIFDNNPGRLLREVVRRAGTASAARRSSRTPRSWTGSCVLHPTRTLEWVEERNWFFRLSKYQDFSRGCSRSARSSCSPRAGATRCSRSSTRGSRTFRPAGRDSRGAFPSPRRSRPASRRRRTCGSTRCRTISRRPAFPARLARALAGAAARCRQGHHALSQRHLAGDAPGGGAAAAGARVGARVRVVRRRAVQQVRRREAGPRRGDRPVRCGRVPLFPAARGAVRRATAASRGSGSRSATTPTSRTR